MSKLLQNLMCVLLTLCLGSAAVQAQEPFPTDGSQITSGTVYTVAAFKNYKATFTAPSTGVLIQNGVPELKLEGDIEPQYLGYGEYGQMYNWNVEGGVTYTISADFIMNAGKVCFTMESDQGLQITDISPLEGEALAANSNYTGTIDIHLNTSASYDEAYLQAGSEQVNVSGERSSGNLLSFSIKDALNSLYANATIKSEGGDPLSLVVKGLRTQSGILYNGDGLLTLNFVAAPKLMEMLSNNVPAVLKSFYPKGDKDGIITFVFDRDLNNDGSIFMSITCGNSESESTFYLEEVPAVVDGPTATIDLTGKLRDLNNYITYQGSSSVGLKLSNVKDLNGQYAAGNGEGNIGSYPYNPRYEYIQPVNVVSEFTPASGSTLHGADQIEIWFNNAQIIDFEGIQFTYNDGGKMENFVVLNENLDILRVNNEVTITASIPEIVKGKDQVTVTLYNVVSYDGHPHEVKAEYDMFIVSLLAPIKPGEAIASTGREDFVFDINRTELYHYIRYDFYNGKDEPKGAQLMRQPNGTFTAENFDITCYKDSVTSMVISAYYNANDYDNGREAAETYTLNFIGTASPFAFSSTKFVSIDPEPYSYIQPSVGFGWNLTFDGLVEIDPEQSFVTVGGYNVVPFKELIPTDSDQGFANNWLLIPDIDALADASYLTITVVAKDMDGALVEGNNGEQENSALTFEYYIQQAIATRPLSVTPAPGEVSSLSRIDITAEGIDTAGCFGADDITISNEKGEVIYRATSQQLYDSSFDLTTWTFLGFFIEPNITAPGVYTLDIPADFFEFEDGGKSDALVAVYTITTSGISSIVLDKADVYTVYTLNGALVLTTADAADLSGFAPGVYVINGRKVLVK